MGNTTSNTEFQEQVEAKTKQLKERFCELSAHRADSSKTIAELNAKLDTCSSRYAQIEKALDNLLEQQKSASFCDPSMDMGFPDEKDDDIIVVNG